MFRAFALVLPVLLGLAPAPRARPAQVPALQATEGRILLVTVVDRGGRTVVDFNADDFLISEGGQDREILDVHIADYPVALLLDDTAEGPNWAAIRSAAVRFVSRIGERPVAVGLLSNNAALVASLEDDRRTVLDRINALSAHAPTTISPLPLIAEATRLLHDTQSPFSAVVVIAASAVNASAPVQGDLLPGILESGAAVHVIEGRSAPRQEQSAPEGSDLLKVIADQTHGQYTTIFSHVSYSIALDRLADRLSSEMMVEYLVPPGVAAGDVRVGVRRPGARVVGLGVSK